MLLDKVHVVQQRSWQAIQSHPDRTCAGRSVYRRSKFSMLAFPPIMEGLKGEGTCNRAKPRREVGAMASWAALVQQVCVLWGALIQATTSCQPAARLQPR